MIPDGWTVKRFAEIARYKAGRTPARANTEYWRKADDGVPWAAISDMDEFATIMDTKEKITQTAFDKIFRRQAMPAGTLIMSFKLTIGRIATLGIDACHNEAIISIFPNPDIDQRYLGYFLAQVDYNMIQDRQVKGNTLNQEKIDRIEIWLPPLSEQSSIADILDLVRRSMHIQEQAFISSCNLKRSVMHTLFTRGLRGEAQKKTEIGPMPQSWVMRPIGEYAQQMQYGLSIRGASQGRYPILRMNCQQDGKVLLRDLQYVDIDDKTINAYRVRPNDILFNRTNSFELVGRTAIVEFDMDIVFASYLVRISVHGGKLNAHFLNHFLNWETAQCELKKLASRGVSQANISVGKLKGFAMPIPKINEQREIAAILEAIDRKIGLHRRKRALLDDLFKALLHKLMTGAIRAADLDLSAITPVQSNT